MQLVTLWHRINGITGSKESLVLHDQLVTAKDVPIIHKFHREELERELEKKSANSGKGSPWVCVHFQIME